MDERFEELQHDLQLLILSYRAMKTRTVYDKFKLDAYNICEKLLKSGEVEHCRDMFEAANAVPESTVKFSTDLSKPRQNYLGKWNDGLFDELLEKHFGKGALYPQINELSNSLTYLRYCLLKNNSKAALVQLADVRAANSALPEVFRKLKTLIAAAADNIETLIQNGEVEHACDLADAVHALPEIVSSPRADLRAYKKCFVKPYSRKWRDGFFEELKEY